MPTRRIGDLNVKVLGRTSACLDLEHDPDQGVVREPGTYQHDCPSCGAQTFFNVTPNDRKG